GLSCVAGVDDDGRAGDETMAALDQRYRTGDDERALVQRTQCCRGLLPRRAVIQTERGFVADTRVYEADHHVRCRGEIAQGHRVAQQAAGEAFERGLVE